jgi:hypothetical protein
VTKLPAMRLGKKDKRRMGDFVNADGDNVIECAEVFREHTCRCGYARQVWLPLPKRWGCIGCGR